MSYLCIKKQEPTAGAKGIMCGGVFLPIESYESEHPTPASQIPSEGLALYVPLSEAPNASEWAGYGSITYKTVDGVPCAYFSGDNSNGLYMGGKALETQTFTVSIVFNTKSFSPTSGYMPYLVNFGPSSTNDNDRLALRFDNYYAGNKNALAMVYYGVYLSVQNLSTDTWYSAQMKFDGTQISLYLNGELQSQLNVSAKEIQSGVWIGKSPSNDGAFNGYLSSMRVYNRALSDAEIALLAREFVFNSAPLVGRKGLLVPVGESVAAPPANGLIFNASYAEDMTNSDGESPVDGTGYTIVEDAAGFKCLNVEKSNMQDSMYYDGTQEKMQFGTGNFAVGFYLKSVKPWSDYNGIILATTLADSGFTGFVFYKNRDSGKKSMVVRFGTITDIYSESDVDTNWHHWLFMRDGDTVKIYKDGKVDATKAFSGSVNANVDLYVGGYYSNWASFTSAYFRLSNVRIYNRALTDAEIQSVALEHNPTKSLFIPLKTAYGTPQVGQKGIIVRSSQVVGYAAYSKSTEAMPTEGLVFYLPCDSDSYTTAQTGQTLSKSGTVTATTVNGIPCLEIKSGSYLSGTLNGFSGDVSMAMSFWFKRLDSSSSAYITAGNGNYDLTNGNEIWGSVESDHIETACGRSGSDARRAGIYNAAIGTGWHHGYFSYDATSKKFKTVLDGHTENAGYSAERSYNFSSGLTLCINSLARATSAVKGNANYSQIRIFNRALTDAEIKTLAREYKPEEVKKMFIAVKEKSAIPENGLVFYAPLQEDKSTAETGQALTKNGTVTYGTESGIPCAFTNGNAYLSFSASGLITMSSDWAISLWIRFSSFTVEYPTPFAIGERHDVGTALRVVYFGGKLCFEPVSSYPGTSQIIEPALNVWYHICIVHSGSLTTMYSDGAEKNEKTFTYSFAPTYGRIGTSLYANGYNEYFDGWISAVRIYNRALDADEISALANEYTPEA